MGSANKNSILSKKDKDSEHISRIQNTGWTQTYTGKKKWTMERKEAEKSHWEFSQQSCWKRGSREVGMEKKWERDGFSYSGGGDQTVWTGDRWKAVKG